MKYLQAWHQNPVFLQSEDWEPDTPQLLFFTLFVPTADGEKKKKSSLK